MLIDEFFRLYGDSDGDGDVDRNDYLSFRSAYRQTSSSSRYNAAFDRDGDGDVDAADLFAFRRQFGARI